MSASAAELRQRVAALGTFFQGPFDLGDGVVVTGISDNSHKWNAVMPLSRLPHDLAGMRVLEIGANAGYDSFQLMRRGPEYLMAVEPNPDFHRQALFLEQHFKSGADFRHLAWQDIPLELNGTFDLVLCLGIPYHEPHPGLLLERIHALLRPGGMVIMESHCLREPHLTEYALFVEGTYLGDEAQPYWFVFGRECLQNMLRRFGFTAVEEWFYEDSPYSRNPEDPETTVEGYDKGGLTWVQAVKS